MDSCEGANNLTLPNSLHLDGKTGLGNTMAWVSYFHALAQNQRVSQVEWSQEIISFKLINLSAKKLPQRDEVTESGATEFVAESRHFSVSSNLLHNI